MLNINIQTKSPYDFSGGAIETTRDKFHDGLFEVLQPAKRGNRSGMDALLLAAALPKNSSGILADLGSGAGVAGLAALNLNPELKLLAVEKNPEMAELDSVDSIIMNPPYNMSRQRAPKDIIKAEAFMMGEGGIDAWFRTAAAITKPGGKLAIIYRTENLGELLACSQGRFGGLEIMPIHSRADEAAKRIIVRGTSASRAQMAIVPGFVVHNEDGSFTEKAEAVFKGKAHLDFTG